MAFDPKKNEEGEEVADMVHALQEIIDDAVMKAGNEARIEARKQSIIELVKEGLLSVTVAAQKLGISEAELKKLI